jgi:hypothetical protein
VVVLDADRQRFSALHTDQATVATLERPVGLGAARGTADVQRHIGEFRQICAPS